MISEYKSNSNSRLDELDNRLKRYSDRSKARKELLVRGIQELSDLKQ